MAKQLFADKAATTMSSALTAGGTTFNVVSGASFPVPTAGNFFYATLYQKPAATEVNIEIVKVTTNAAGAFTLAQRDVTNITGTGGSGYAYPGSSGTVYVELRTIAKNMEAMFQADDLTATAVANTPAGNIAATTVQAAINELDTEKAALASPNFSGSPQKAGVSLATTTDVSTSVTNERSTAATLTNKTLDPATCKIGVLSGLMKMTGGAPAAATVRTDYAEPTTALATGLLKNTTGTGAHSIAVAGTDYQAPIGTISGVVKGTGTNAIGAASPGVDFVAPGGALGTPSSGTLTYCTGYTYANLSGAIPTWNQSTTGSAASLSATLVVGSGGTGLTAPGTAGNVLTSTGTGWMSSPQSGGVSLASAQATTASASIDIAATIPDTVKRVTLLFNSISTNGAAHLLVQLGAGSIQTTGYAGSADNGSASFTSSTGFGIVLGASTAIISGRMDFTLVGSNIYICDYVMGRHDTGNVNRGGGVVTLSGALGKIRIATANGSDLIDVGGSFGIQYFS
jgi:hypothetical protein